MNSVTQSVDELIQQAPDQDNRDNFVEMWGILGELRERVEARFSVTLDPSVKDLADYGSPDGQTKGHLSALAGDEVDWVVHSYMGTPGRGFCNMHFNVWLGPQIDVPHFGFAMGTIPDMFCYLDLIPRADLVADLDYLDRYYEPRNAAFLSFEADPEFRPFVSRTLYMRQSQSQTSLCYIAKPTAPNIDRVRKAAHEMLDQWFDFVAQAKAVPTSKQGELAARDLRVRRAIAERDPANVMGEKIFGKDVTKRLVATLWGQSRELNRAGSWQQ